MSYNSSGEVEMVYECDTDRFHRYRGHKDGKEITIYIERGTRVALFRFNAIVSINDRKDIPERSFAEKVANHTQNYGMSQGRFRAMEREAQFQQDLKDSIEWLKHQLQLLANINTSISFVVNQLGLLRGELTTKINPRRPTKKWRVNHK